MSQRRHHREIARQDVQLHASGPAEFYRSDRNSKKCIDRAQRDCLSTKYKKNKSELNTMRHLTVNGDKISYSNPHRNYIYHRQAFDWYNSRRALILDDIEEILPVAGSLAKPHVRNLYDSSQYFKAFSRYAPPENCFDDESDESEDEPEPPSPLKLAPPPPPPAPAAPAVRFEKKQPCCVPQADIEKIYENKIAFKATSNTPSVIYHGNVRADGTFAKKNDDFNQVKAH